MERDLRKAILEAAYKYHMLQTYDTPDVQLKYYWPEDLILREMELLVKEGYLTQGVILKSSWPTEKGLQILEG